MKVELVERINKYFGVFKADDFIVLPTSEINCPICGGKLILHDFRCYKHTNQDPIHKHCDVHFKCRDCDFFMTFGLPVSEDAFNKLSQSKYHGRLLRWELENFYEDEVIRERLKMLGYW